MSIKIEEFPSYSDATEKEGKFVVDCITGGATVIGFASGSSPIRLYHELVEAYRARSLDFTHKNIPKDLNSVAENVPGTRAFLD